MSAVLAARPDGAGQGLRGAPARTTADGWRGPVRSGVRRRSVGAGRCWSWPPRPRPRCGPGRSASGRLTGFGMVSPLPGIWPSLHLDTSITLPVGVAAYAASRARLAGPRPGDQRPDLPVRQMVGDLLVRARHGRAGGLSPDGSGRDGPGAGSPFTTIVSCLPVLVLAMGTALAHMLRADAGATDTPAQPRPDQPHSMRSVSWSPADQAGPGCKRPEADQGPVHKARAERSRARTTTRP